MTLVELLLRVPPPTPKVIGRVHRMGQEESYPDHPEMLVCACCGEEKPADAFYFNANRDRYSTECRKCERAKRKAKEAKIGTSH